MNVATHRKMQSTVVLVVASALALLAVTSASAYSEPRSTLVAARLGSPDPRDTAQADVAAGLVPSQLGTPDPRDNAVPAEPAHPVRPDGAALRAVFNELAAQAVKSRARASKQPAAEVASTGSWFSWRDAGIGGGIALLLVGVVGLAFVLATHGRKKELARA